MAALYSLLLLRRAVSRYLRSSSSSSSVLHLHNRLFASGILPFSTCSSKSPSLDKPPCNLEQTASATFAKNFILDGLPFDSIAEDRCGTITLRRKTNNEIIEIEVQKNINYWYSNDEDDDHDVYLRHYHSFDYYGYGVDNVDVTVGSHVVIGANVNDDDHHHVGDDVPPLSISVKILYGNNFNRCLIISGHAFSDDLDCFVVDKVSIRNSKKRGVPVSFLFYSGVPGNDGRKHLEEFEDFYKKRGIEPCNLNFLFNYIKKKIEIEKDCASIGMSNSRICTDRSPPVSYHNIIDKTENDIASYSNEMVLPIGLPFELHSCLGKQYIYMERVRSYQGEGMTVTLLKTEDNFQVSGDDPFIVLDVEIRKGDMYINAAMTIKPDRLDIHQVLLRYLDENAEYFKEYVKTRGITSKTISFLYDRLGYKLKNGIPLEST